MEFTKELVYMINLCGGDAEHMERISQDIVRQFNGLQLAASRAAYVAGYNDAVAKDAKQCLNGEDFDAMIAETSGITSDETKPLPDNDLEEAAEIEAEKSCKTCIVSDKCFGAKHNVVCDKYHEQGSAVDFGLGEAKKEARAGFFSMQDYRHALASPGVTMCGGDATVNIEITEGARVNCPLCLEAIEDEEKQS